MPKLILFITLTFLFTTSIVNAKNIRITNAKILNQTIYAPDYLLAIESGKTSPALNTIANVVSSGGIDRKDQYVSEIFVPGTAFKVVELYQHQPSLLRSAFASSYYFAILERNGKKYIVEPMLNEKETNWEMYTCKNNRDRCGSWSNVLKECVEKLNGKNCLVNYDIYLIDEKNNVKRKSNPPYSKALIEKNLAGFLNYAKGRPKMDNVVNYIHLNVTSKLDALEFANSILHFEELNVDSVSPVSMASWEEFKRYNKTNTNAGRHL